MRDAAPDIVEHVSLLRSDSSCDHGNALRIRRCCNPSCGIVFAICAGCDRGQRYCSSPCRELTRHAQLRAAGRRYQCTAAGRAKHCQRQRAYRKRESSSVTHQGLRTSGLHGLALPGHLSSCAICGRFNRWIRPFDSFPPRRLIKKTRF